jgi:hypothetical protein
MLVCFLLTDSEYKYRQKISLVNLKILVRSWIMEHFLVFLVYEIETENLLITKKIISLFDYHLLNCHLQAIAYSLSAYNYMSI